MCKKLKRKTEKVKMKGMISFGRAVLKHLWLTCVNYGEPRPSSVISRTPSGVLVIFLLGSLYFCLSRQCMKSGGLFVVYRVCRFESYYQGIAFHKYHC